MTISPIGILKRPIARIRPTENRHLNAAVIVFPFDAPVAGVDAVFEYLGWLGELDRIIDDDRYPFSPRIRTLTAIRDKLRPPPVREPLPPLWHYAPPRVKASRRRG